MVGDKKKAKMLNVKLNSTLFIRQKENWQGILNHLNADLNSIQIDT